MPQHQFQPLNNINHRLGDDLRVKLNPNTRLKIAASYFSIYAYEALKQELEQIDSLQFIFTSPTFVAEKVTDKLNKAEREFMIPQINRENSLYGTEFEIHLRNKLTQKAIAKECADWVKRKAIFKSNKTNATMQEMINVEQGNNPDETISYFPIQGFTPVSLGYENSDAISNIVTKNPMPAATNFLQIFDLIWQDESKVKDVTDEIVKHMESVYQENPPERIYFLMLYHIFQDFLDDTTADDVMPNDRTGYQDTQIWQKLFQFQKDAAVGIINKLETYNGCILADSVGLGKTFTALAVIKYYELRNKSVLVLCPKKLADNWKNYTANLVTNELAKDRFAYDVFYHTDLSRQSGQSNGVDLSKVNWGNYDFLVIDESHNFRNRDTFQDRETRYQRLMDTIIRQGVKTKVLMLSATPVNNRFTDLKNQLALAYEGNAALLDNKLDTERNVETIFQRAQTSFNRWTKLPPEERTTTAILNMLDLDFFKLLDSVTIARSRKHIQTFYDTKDIGNFPQRLTPLSFRCQIAEKMPEISFKAIAEQLKLISMAVYAPLNYIFPSQLEKYEARYDTITSTKSRFKQKDRERSLQTLMTVNLLKRLESSVESFRLTLTSLQTSIQSVLNQIADFEKRKGQGEISLAPTYDSILSADLDELDGEDFIGNTQKIHLADLDILQWQRELNADLEIIQGLLALIAPVSPEQDSKLQHLAQQITQKVQNPINGENKKVIIFTAFADTADYLYRTLAPMLWEKCGLFSAKITGTDNQTNLPSPPNRDMQTLLTLFSPQSKHKAKIFPNEQREIDVLIATDCISEGQNLQDCDYLINFDIHWNPVRIIQRFGRIDRIGSTNQRIQLANYWPDINLDEYINLRERVENKMLIVDIAGTGDDNVLTAQANDVAYRKRQLQQLQNEVLDLEDNNSGVSITDLGLNDFRMDLLSYLNTHPELKTLPKGLHTVVPTDTAKGLKSGVIFTLKSRHNHPQLSNQNRLYPYYLVYIGTDGNIIADHSQAKKLLDLARFSCRGKTEPLPEVYEPFNHRTKDGKDMEHYSKLLDNAIRQIQQTKQQSDIDSLFSGRQTTALLQDIQSHRDFELISFIVIENAA